MKQYEFIIKARTPSKVEDVLWYMKRTLRQVLPFEIEITTKEVEDRPTSDEHHGGVESKEPEPYTKEQQDWMKQIPERY